jgi:hypothetical protein
LLTQDKRKWEEKQGVIDGTKKELRANTNLWSTRRDGTDRREFMNTIENKQYVNKSFKAELKEATRKTNPMSFDERVRKLKQIQRGWINNFRLANIQGKLLVPDGWLRNRLRYCIWHHWNRTAGEFTTGGSKKRKETEESYQARCKPQGCF